MMEKYLGQEQEKEMGKWLEERWGVIGWSSDDWKSDEQRQKQRWQNYQNSEGEVIGWESNGNVIEELLSKL